MRKSNKIIVGSGLAGPLLAIYLSQRGHAVDLFEKRPDIRKENISVGRSINLALSHRGIKALKSADAFDQIEPILIPMKGRMVHLLDGEIKFQPYSVHSNEYINSVSRGKLNKILMSKATASGKVQIYFNHSLLKIDEINKELKKINESNTNLGGHRKPHTAFATHTKKLKVKRLDAWHDLKEYAKKSKGENQIDLPGYGLTFLKMDKDIAKGNLRYKDTAFENPNDGYLITKKAFDSAWDKA